MRKLTKTCESAVFRHWPGQCMTEIYSGQDTRWVVKPPQFSAWRHFLCRCGMEEPKQSIIFYSAGRQRSEIGIAEVCRTKKARVERGALLLNSTFCMYRIKFHEARQKKKNYQGAISRKIPGLRIQRISITRKFSRNHPPTTAPTAKIMYFY